jgi:glycosyltransferase involved in cell wall biosynthesis
MDKHNNIGFVSTRFAGTDGVTLESSKWADVLESNGYRCYWFAGKLDRDEHKCFPVPEAYFQHERNMSINKRIIGQKRRNPQATSDIHQLRSLLKKHLHAFIKRFDIDLLVAENALSIPMHVPLGLALTETIAETQIPTIAHHHDFYWERIRFSCNAVSDYLRMAFPPNLPNIQHVVINSEAQEQLALRTGISSTIIPNVLDFEHPPSSNSEGSRRFRNILGLQPDDRIILQPTRIIQRKGIERAIELVRELKDPRNKLVVSHEAGDEGFEYLEWLKEYACEQNVDLRLVTVQITDPWLKNGEHKKTISLWDVYPFADFITYPSLYEGFGNAFIEAVYFKKPVLINRYANFIRDIEPLGFDLAVMDGYLSKRVVQKVKQILTSTHRRDQMVNLNYEIAARHYSYPLLRRRLSSALSAFYGDTVQTLTSGVQRVSEDSTGINPDQVAFRHFDANCT